LYLSFIVRKILYILKKNMFWRLNFRKLWNRKTGKRVTAVWFVQQTISTILKHLVQNGHFGSWGRQRSNNWCIPKAEAEASESAYVNNGVYVSFPIRGNAKTALIDQVVLDFCKKKQSSLWNRKA
jgi:hypothetical protein